MVAYERASRNPSMKVGFYVGCLINYAYTDIADAVIEVLNQLGVEVLAPPKSVVLWHQPCGMEYIFFTNDEHFKKSRQRMRG